MSELLDMLLSADCPNVAKNLPEKRIEVVTLSQRLGKKAVFTIKALPYGKVQALRQMDERNTSLNIVLEGCVDPDWRSKELPDEYEPGGKKRLEEGGDPELNLLYYLYLKKGIPPWDVCQRSRGYRDLIEAFALVEMGK